jgi:hypothetical protein
MNDTIHWKYWGDQHRIQTSDPELLKRCANSHHAQEVGRNLNSRTKIFQVHKDRVREFTKKG